MSSLSNYTQDLFLGGRAVVYQAAKGRHRSGSDAVLLAASLPQTLSGSGYDLGSASGAAGFCVAARLENVHVTLVDVDQDALSLAGEALSDARNARFSERIRLIEADVTENERMRSTAGLERESADFVLCNPPYFSAGEVRASPQSDKALAHVLGEDGFLPWVKTAVSVLKPGGLAAFIIRAETLLTFLNAFDARFGAVTLLALHPYSNQAASHYIIQGQKGSKAALRSAYPLVLRNQSSMKNNGQSPNDLGYTAETEAILREGAALDVQARL